MRWVAGYERAWRDGDLDAVEALFTTDAVYRRSPYMAPDVGIDAIKAFWLEDDDEVFAMQAEPVAVEGDVAVVRVEVRYGDPVRQEYRELWVDAVRRRRPRRRLRGVAVLAGPAVRRAGGGGATMMSAVVVERCEECGFDGSRWTDAEAIAATAALPGRWRRAIAGLDGDDLARRPIAGMWSIAEYTDHVRETAFGMRFLLDVVRLRPRHRPRRPARAAVRPRAPSRRRRYGAHRVRVGGRSALRRAPSHAGR